MVKQALDWTREEQFPRMTYEEFLAWAPDGKQAEWVDGEVTVLTVSDRHDALSLMMITALSTYVRMRELGRVLHPPFQMRLRFRPAGREPDVLFVRNENLHRIDKLWIEGAADLVIEFLSEQTARTDLIVKLHEYERAGLPEYVIVDARDDREGFLFYRLGEDGRYQQVEPDADGRYHSTMIPGFWFDPAWFKQTPLPDAETIVFEIAGDAYEEWILSRRRFGGAWSSIER